MPKAIIFIGPPGAGKGTQADLLVEAFPNYIHFDTGHALEAVLMDPRNQDDPVIQTERKIFESGKINTTSWTMSVMRDHVNRIAGSGKGIIFSGSPRRREEADDLIPFLQETYGANALTVFHIVVPREVSVFRNSHRRVCKKCGSSIVWSPEAEKMAFCPKCGGELVTRSLDKPEIIERRYVEYERLTESILPFFTSLGIPIVDIDGTKSPEEVHASIVNALSRI